MAGKTKTKTEKQDSGFILLHRKIRLNGVVWDIREPRKYMWWCDILMECNHEQKQVSLGFMVLDCKRGESLNSLLTWSKRWMVNVTTVRRFLKMLENANMIVLKNEQKTTRITVCNYSNYNEMRNGKQSQSNSDAIPTQFGSNTNKQLLKQLEQDLGSSGEKLDKNGFPINYKIWTKEQFLASLEKYNSKYSRSMIYDFSVYWREKNNAGKMKFQTMDTWQTGLRLARWKKNDDKKAGTSAGAHQSTEPMIDEQIIKNRKLQEEIAHGIRP